MYPQPVAKPRWTERASTSGNDGFQTHGLEGLKDLPPIVHNHPQTTSAEVEEKIIAASLEHPGYGCIKLSAYLKLQGISVSSPTIQKILIRHNLGQKHQRWLRIEEKHLTEGMVPTPEQVRKIEKYKPCFKERHIESGQPGELLAQDTFFVGTLKGVGPECAVAVLHNEALPFYREHNIPVGAVLTDNGKEFCGTETHPFELYLAFNDIEHRRTQIKRPQSNGFVERFNRMVLDEFFRIAFRETFYESVDALQADLDVWLHHYNYERPHLGYRNLGKRPFDTIQDYIASRQDMKISGTVSQ